MDDVEKCGSNFEMSPPCATTSSRFCVVCARARAGAAASASAPAPAAVRPSSPARRRKSRRDTAPLSNAFTSASTVGVSAFRLSCSIVSLLAIACGLAHRCRLGRAVAGYAKGREWPNPCQAEEPHGRVAAGLMALTPAEFRTALRSFAAGVTVVTTRDREGRPSGLTASAFTSVSLDPPLVLVCVDHAATAHPDFRERGWFAVNVLRREQEALSRRFAVSGGDKFRGVACHEGRDGPAAPRRRPGDPRVPHRRGARGGGPHDLHRAGGDRLRRGRAAARVLPRQLPQPHGGR